MYKRSGGLKYVPIEKDFIRLLIGQGLMEFGDNIRLLATTMLLFNLTGSGLAAGFSLVMTPIVGIILSPLAGVLGDGLDGRRYLAGLYLLQGALVFLIIIGISLHTIYLVLILFAAVQIVEDPVYRKMVRHSLQNSDIMIGNSLSVGVSGVSNLLGPILGGIGIHFWGMKMMFVVSALCSTVSSLVILSMGKCSKEGFTIKTLEPLATRFSREIGEGIGYFWRMDTIRELGIANLILSFGTTSVSLAFYSLAFDVMGIGSGGWGFILSVFYSTRLLAMFISIMLNTNREDRSPNKIYLPLFCTCLSWLLYGFVGKLSYIIFALILEGTSHFLFEILLWTKLQIISKKVFMARIAGIINILSNCARITGIILTYIIIQIYNIHAVFIANAVFIFIYAFFMMMAFRKV